MNIYEQVDYYRNRAEAWEKVADTCAATAARDNKKFLAYEDQVEELLATIERLTQERDQAQEEA